MWHLVTLLQACKADGTVNEVINTQGVDPLCLLPRPWRRTLGYWSARSLSAPESCQRTTPRLASLNPRALLSWLAYRRFPCWLQFSLAGPLGALPLMSHLVQRSNIDIPTLSSDLSTQRFRAKRALGTVLALLIHQSINPSIHQSLSPSVHQSLSSSVYQSINLSVYQSLSSSVY